MSRWSCFYSPRLPFVIILGLLCVCLAGCGDAIKLEKPAPQKSYFVLKPTREGANASSGPAKGVLTIKALNVVPNFNSRELIYRLQDDQYATDYYNLLLTSPGSQLGQCIHDWFNNSGVFHYVINSNSEVEPSFILETSIRQFYGDFRESATPAAVLDLQFFLLQEKDYEFNVVFTKEFQKQIPIEARTPEALVKGYNTGLTEILQSLENDLQLVVSQTDDTPKASPPSRRHHRHRKPDIRPQ